MKEKGMCAKSLQLCPTLCDPMDNSQPDFSVHGILQARILEWFPSPGVFLTQGSNPYLLSLLRFQAGSLPLTSLLLEQERNAFSKIPLPSIPLKKACHLPSFTLLVVILYLGG